jgi:hypothetical protein
MVICGVVASESLLTYDSVRSGGIPRSALHLTIPEQAPTSKYSDILLGSSIRYGTNFKLCFNLLVPLNLSSSA